MTFRYSRLTLTLFTLAASGAVSAVESTTPGVDPCVVYPYYGRTSTPGPEATPEVDPCVVYPYYGRTSTPVPEAPKVVATGSGVVETPEDLDRVLAALRYGQYLGL